MDTDRPRWGICDSTLMLLVTIAALVVERWNRWQDEQQLMASRDRAVEQADRRRSGGSAAPR
jgi:hypothetical protein